MYIWLSNGSFNNTDRVIRYTVYNMSNSIKTFLSDLFAFIFNIVMWIPCSFLRKIVCKLTMMEYHFSSKLRRNVDIRSPYRIRIGHNSHINKNVVLDGRGGLSIGNNVDIAQDVNIWTEQHDYNSEHFSAITDEVVIEDYVWMHRGQQFFLV